MVPSVNGGIQGQQKNQSVAYQWVKKMQLCTSTNGSLQTEPWTYLSAHTGVVKESVALAMYVNASMASWSRCPPG